MIEVYGVFLIIFFLCVFYVLGIITANWFNERAKAEQKHALEVQFMRLRANTDYNDPSGPYKASTLASVPMSVGCPRKRWRPKQGFSPAQLAEFEARLKDNGQAVIQLDKNPTTTK